MPSAIFRKAIITAAFVDDILSLVPREELQR